MLLTFAHRLLGFCFIAMCSCTLVASRTPRPTRRAIVQPSERWKQDLTSVTSLDQAYPIVDQYIARQTGSRQEKIAAGIDGFVRDRFVHGQSTIFIDLNWLSRLFGLLWRNLSYPVTPESILNHRHAICSQQSIVFESLLEHYKIHYASVQAAWPDPDPTNRGHFAVAALIDGKWRFYDPDKEPKVTSVPLQDITNVSGLRRIYVDNPRLVKELNYAALHGQLKLSYLDHNPAPRGALFERTMRWMSAKGWLVAGAMWMICILLSRAYLKPQRGAQLSTMR